MLSLRLGDEVRNDSWIGNYEHVREPTVLQRIVMGNLLIIEMLLRRLDKRRHLGHTMPIGDMQRTTVDMMI